MVRPTHRSLGKRKRKQVHIPATAAINAPTIPIIIVKSGEKPESVPCRDEDDIEYKRSDQAPTGINTRIGWIGWFTTFTLLLIYAASQTGAYFH